MLDVIDAESAGLIYRVRDAYYCTSCGSALAVIEGKVSACPKGHLRYNLAKKVTRGRKASRIRVRRFG